MFHSWDWWSLQDALRSSKLPAEIYKAPDGKFYLTHGGPKVSWTLIRDCVRRGWLVKLDNDFYCLPMEAKRQAHWKGQYD